MAAFIKVCMTFTDKIFNALRCGTGIILPVVLAVIDKKNKTRDMSGLDPWFEV